MHLLIKGVKVDNGVASIAETANRKHRLREQFKAVVTSDRCCELAREVVVLLDAPGHTTATKFAKDAPHDDTPRG